MPPGNPGERQRIEQAHQHAQPDGIHAVADRLAIPAATFRRLLRLYDLDQHAGPPKARLVGEGVQANG